MSVEKLTDQTAFETLEQTLPEMIKSIRALIRMGQNPDQIADRMKNRGYDPLIVEMIRGAGWHIVNNKA